MKKKCLYTIGVFILVCVAFLPKVNAAYIHASEAHWDGNNIIKVADGVLANTYMWDINVDVGGSNYGAFCIDYGATITAGTATEYSLSEYFQNALSETDANTLTKKINEYIYFGYGSTGRTSEKYYLATQKLIWLAISNSGFYSSSFYSNKVASYNFSTFEYTYNGANGARIDLSGELSSITNSITNHYKKPSFCSSQDKLEIAVGETAEYTDSNNVLSNYDVTCSEGLTCSTNDNKLSVTVNKNESDHKITFSKGKSGIPTTLYRIGNNQGIVNTGGEVPAVSCTFGIDSYENVQTGGMKGAYIAVAALFCIAISYIVYTTSKSLKQSS